MYYVARELVQTWNTKLDQSTYSLGRIPKFWMESGLVSTEMKWIKGCRNGGWGVEG